MSPPEHEGGATEYDIPDRNGEELYPDEERIRGEWAQRKMTREGGHLVVRHRDWAPVTIGETLYMYTLLILRWGWNGFMGGKVNRKSQTESEMGISLGRKGDWKTASIAQWRMATKEKFITHLLVSPFEVWGILMAWRKGIRAP